MFQDKRIAFVGPGQMAEAMIAGLLRNQLLPPENILASGPLVDHNAMLQTKYGITTMWDNAAAAARADVVILSVKPQHADAALAQLAGKIRPDALVLSIVAGLCVSRIASGLSHPLVARAMPNTPARIGQGISVFTTAHAVDDRHRQWSQEILGALGQVLFVEEEEMLDMATALSGTGPAYVFLFMEAMIDAGVHLGFPRHMAETLVSQTVLGSAMFFQKSPDTHLAQLRNTVTSPAGTTAAALFELEKAGFRTAISNAVWAAFERSTELGRNVKNHKPE